CPTEQPDGETVVASIAEALSVTSDNGTISLCDGTHQAYNVVIDRPVTVTSAGPGVATIDADTARWGLELGFGATGTIKLHKLKFTRGRFASVTMGGPYGSIVIDSSEFRPISNMVYGATTFTSSAGISVGLATGNGITIRANSFINGDVGVLVNGGTSMLRKNTYNGQANAAIRIGTSNQAANVTVDSSSFSNCGASWCVGAFGTAATTMAFANNTFLVDIA